MKTQIIFPVTKHWFDMFASGEKKEEYRAMTPYWVQRLTTTTNLHGLNPLQFKRFDEVVITCGYPAKGDKTRRLVFEHVGTRIGKGKPEIDCFNSDMERFIVKVGKRIE